MDLSALTVEHWIFIALSFLMWSALSFWRIRECIHANPGDKRLPLKIVIAVVLCIITVVSTVLMLCYLPDCKWAGIPEYKSLIPGVH